MTTTAMIDRMSRVRSSTRCDRNVSCAAVGSAGSVIAGERQIRSKPGSEGWRGGSAGAASASSPPGSFGSGAGSARRADVGLGRRRVGLGRARVQLLLDAAHARLHAARGALDGRLEVGRGGLHLLLELAQFIELDFAADVRLDVVHVALQAAEQVPQRARGLGQPFGADDDQRHDGDDDDFGEADVEHGSGGRRAGSCANRAVAR